MLASLAREGTAVIRLAEAGRLGVVFGAEPAIRTRQRRIARASPKMIDAEIAGDTGAERVLAFDAATRRHGEVLRKQRLTYFAILVGSASAAKQRAIFLSGAEFMRTKEATFPKAAAVFLASASSAPNRSVPVEAAFRAKPLRTRS